MAPINAFIIHRPFQVLNATEYAMSAGLDHCQLFVIEDEDLCKDYFAEISDSNVWEHIEVLPLRDWHHYVDLSDRGPSSLSEMFMEKIQLVNQVRKRWIIDRFTRRISPVNELILGSYRKSYAEYMRHIANRVSYKKLVLVDVGTDTLEIGRQRREEITEVTSADADSAEHELSACRILHRSFREKLVEWDTTGASSLTFFTSYDIDVVGHDRLLRNEYSNLRSTLGSKTCNGQVWFLGQPIADQEYLTWESFDRLMRAVIDIYGNDRFVYVAHPYESERQLEVVRRAGARTERFSMPIEIMLGRQNASPSLLSGFFSSAISGCAAIFGNTLRYEAIRIPDSMLVKQRQNLAEIYRSFSENKPEPIRVQPIAAR